MGLGSKMAVCSFKSKFLSPARPWHLSSTYQPCPGCDRQDIQTLFDVHIEAIMSRIKKRLDWLTEEGLRDQVVSSF